MKISEGSVRPRPRVGRVLIADGVGPLIPHTGPQDAQCGVVREVHDVADLAIAIELVDAAGGDDGGGAVVVVLLGPVSIGIGLVIELPAAAQVSRDSDVL